LSDQTTIADPLSLPLMPLGTDPDSGLQIYRHIGAGSAPTGDSTSEGRLPLRPDLLTSTGPWASALAVFSQDLAGVNVFRFAPLLVPVRIDVHLRGDAAGESELFGKARILKRSKNTIITTARIYRGTGSDVPLGYSSIHFATMGSSRETPLDFARTQVTVPRQAPPDLLSWIGATPRDDGRGYDLTEVTEAITEGIALGGSPARVVHGGPLQVLAEGAAMTVAESVAGESPRLEDFATTFLAPAKHPPLSAIGELVVMTKESVDIRVEVCNADGSLAAVSEARFRRMTG
jgi:acyl-coenzyme A thioesterase PaaI-like protein